MPTLPFMKNSRPRAPPFYGLDDELPLMLAIATGLQHALAMLAGNEWLITEEFNVSLIF